MKRRSMSVLSGAIGMAGVLLAVLGGPRPVMGQLSSIPKPRIAFVDLAVKGEVGIPGAGEVLAELLLTSFPGKRYQAVERSQFAAILKAQDLTFATVRDNPEKAYARLKGVNYLVLGSISKLKSYTVTARVVDGSTGEIVQQAAMSAETVEDLEDCVGEVAKVLEMTGDEKRAYLDETQFAAVLEQARAKVTARDYEAAVVLYRRCLAIRPDAVVSAELRKAKEELNKALRVFYGKLTIVAAASTGRINSSHNYSHAHEWDSGLTSRVRDAIKEAHRRNGVRVTADFKKANVSEEQIWSGIGEGDYSAAATATKKLDANMLIWVVADDSQNLIEVRVVAADTGEEILSRTFGILEAKSETPTGILVKQDSPVFAQIFLAVMRAWREHIAVK